MMVAGSYETMCGVHKRRMFFEETLLLTLSITILSSKEIIDYTAGIKDLKSKVIKFIGDPEQRIKEDPIRILRAIRFAAKLDFKIETRALPAIEKYRAQISDMPTARVYEEITKLYWVTARIHTACLKNFEFYKSSFHILI